MAHVAFSRKIEPFLCSTKKHRVRPCFRKNCGIVRKMTKNRIKLGLRLKNATYSQKLAAILVNRLVTVRERAKNARNSFIRCLGEIFLLFLFYYYGRFYSFSEDGAIFWIVTLRDSHWLTKTKYFKSVLAKIKFNNRIRNLNNSIRNSVLLTSRTHFQKITIYLLSLTFSPF